MVNVSAERAPQTSDVVTEADFVRRRRDRLSPEHDPAFELAAAHLRWLAGFGQPQFESAAQCFDSISQGNKALILKGARVAHTGKPFNPAPAMEAAAQAWDRAMEAIDSAILHAA